MLNRSKFLLGFATVLLLTINSIGQQQPRFEFVDSQKAVYTAQSFAEKWNKDLNTNIKYFFILVETPTSKNSNYIMQNKFLDKMKSKFEDLHLIWIDGCWQECGALSGYKLKFGKNEKVQEFRVSIFDSNNSKVVSSDKPLSDIDIGKKIKSWR